MHSPYPHLPGPEDACCKVHNPKNPKLHTDAHKERNKESWGEMKHTNEMMSRNWQPCFFRDDRNSAKEKPENGGQSQCNCRVTHLEEEPIKN